MNEIAKLVEDLSNKDNKYAYKCLKQLEEESQMSNSVYLYFDDFVNMLDSPNSYIRTRGMILIAANAKWDKDYKIDEIINKYLKHIMDDKPITARQCIKALPTIAKYKLDLVNCICTALRKADAEIYKNSMQSLVYNDIVTALREIDSI
ncbi:hypothetical protein SAMN05446037_1001409 [Anaerovirgula multivorans]|uniref:SufBD protein n=1 Tax=Anaerovirgula multivorans TaxID=312168 RepID=A0A239A863_9FIRM|nr:SufBD protein [Anaerovirgula multivorans]SNR91760.1 hypothetical protein SAMN05446037_1001409 [Anaerovirgula multivorans]